MLFDPTERTYTGPADEAEPHFTYWNRSARPLARHIRQELELWYAHYPDGTNDLRSRFRSADDVQHQAAFFELFLHELLLRLGCTVEIHPAVPGTSKRPEFRAVCAA